MKTHGGVGVQIHVFLTSCSQLHAPAALPLGIKPPVPSEWPQSRSERYGEAKVLDRPLGRPARRQSLCRGPLMRIGVGKSLGNSPYITVLFSKSILSTPLSSWPWVQFVVKARSLADGNGMKGPIYQLHSWNARLQSPSRGIIWYWSRVWSNKGRNIFRMEANTCSCTPGRCMALLLLVSVADRRRRPGIETPECADMSLISNLQSYVSGREAREIQSNTDKRTEVKSQELAFDLQNKEFHGRQMRKYWRTCRKVLDMQVKH
jgi:hypothetical protein